MHAVSVKRISVRLQSNCIVFSWFACSSAITLSVSFHVTVLLLLLLFFVCFSLTEYGDLKMGSLFDVSQF